MNQRSNRGQFSFSKDERITNKKVIQNLFGSGIKIIVSPFILKYLVDRNESKNKVLISVSKSKIKSSVKRNLLKRGIRESFRLNKNIIIGLGNFVIEYPKPIIIFLFNLKDSLIPLFKRFLLTDDLILDLETEIKTLFLLSFRSTKYFKIKGDTIIFIPDPNKF
jgi:ribonuclease P protein component